MIQVSFRRIPFTTFGNTKMSKSSAVKLADVEVPTPFESTVNFSESARKTAFQKYVDRMEDRLGIGRQTISNMIAKRTGRTIWSINSWLTISTEGSKGKHKAIPWATMDLLLIEELIMDAGKGCSCSKFRLGGLNKNYEISDDS